MKYRFPVSEETLSILKNYDFSAKAALARILALKSGGKRAQAYYSWTSLIFEVMVK